MDQQTVMRFAELEKRCEVYESCLTDLLVYIAVFAANSSFNELLMQVHQIRMRLENFEAEKEADHGKANDSNA